MPTIEQPICRCGDPMTKCEGATDHHYCANCDRCQDVEQDTGDENVSRARKHTPQDRKFQDATRKKIVHEWYPEAFGKEEKK